MEKLKFGILGLNYDTEAGRGWPGARYAPDSIRTAMNGMMNRIEEGFLFDVDENRLVDYNKIEMKDFGNCDNIVHYDHFQALKDMSEEIKKVMAEGYKPILLGGDHSVTNAGFMALHEVAEGKIGIIDFDAHLDIKVDSDVQGKYSGSSEIRRAIEMEKYDPKNIVEIGPRGYNYPEHYHFIKNSGLNIFTSRDVVRLGVDEIVEQTLELVRKDTDYVYMTVDIDALDMAYALGSGGQEPAGLTHFQLSDLIKAFAPYVDVIDFVEVNPMTDHRELTSHVCANLVLDYVAANYYDKFRK
ncbi:MAG: arginase family protein [Peptostreptococcaceae bacterium]|nr:arginase family protein [Peptostreptococcaceae bacterium]